MVSFNLKLILFVLFIFFKISNLTTANINIDTIINDKIITNFDILKEVKYLKILNPNLKQLNKDQLNNLARQSLIKEIIKKDQITKFFDLNQKNPIIEQYYSNLFLRLGYKNQKNFENILLDNKTYSSKEIKSKILIEFYWNDLVFNKYNNQIEIDRNKLIKKIDSLENKNNKSFFLSEIVFKKQADENLEDTIIKIKKAIKDIGFGNAANLYSIADSSKFAGKIGWIQESALTEKIQKELKSLKINQISNPLRLADSYVIFKVEDIRVTDNKIDKDKELKRIEEIEKNKRLEKFSRIYFNKVKMNYQINEK